MLEQARKGHTLFLASTPDKPHVDYTHIAMHYSGGEAEYGASYLDPLLASIGNSHSRILATSTGSFESCQIHRRVNPPVVTAYLKYMPREPAMVDGCFPYH